MDYRDEVFMSVAENLSFSKAATDLFISQPAVTKHIKELENKLNVALFDRKGNKIYLTKAGKLTYNYLKGIKQKYRDLEFEIGRLSDSFKGSLRIGASSTISQYLIPPVLAAFHKRYPKINLYLFNGNSFDMEKTLISHKTDIALVENMSSQRNLKYTDFLDDELVVVTGCDSVYSRRKNISVADLLEIPIILREKGSGTLEVIQKAFAKQNIFLDKLNILIHLGSTEAIKNFLCNFDGIAIVSEKSIEKELRLKSIVKLNVKGFSIPRKFRIVQNLGPSIAIPDLFIDFIFHYNF